MEDMLVIRVVLFGEAVAKGRPRVMGKFAFTPKKTRQFESTIGMEARREMDRRGFHEPIMGAIGIRMSFFRMTPKSISKKKAEMAEAGGILPVGRPDLDNLAKAITDGMNQIIYRDDAQVVEMHARKRYSATPRVEVEVYQKNEWRMAK